MATRWPGVGATAAGSEFAGTLEFRRNSEPAAVVTPTWRKWSCENLVANPAGLTDFGYIPCQSNDSTGSEFFTNRGAMLRRHALRPGGGRIYPSTILPPAGRGRCKYLILRFSQGSKVDIARIRYLEVWQFQFTLAYHAYGYTHICIPSLVIQRCPKPRPGDPASILSGCQTPA